MNSCDNCGDSEDELPDPDSDSGSEYVLATKDGGETWDIFLFMDEYCEHVAKLECSLEMAEEIVDALNYVLNNDWSAIQACSDEADGTIWN